MYTNSISLRLKAFLGAVALLLTLAACAPAAPPTPTPAPPAPTPTGPQLKVTRHATLGSILVDDEGKILYLTMRDERNKPNYTSQTFPRVAGDKWSAGEGVAAGLLKSTNLSDGAKQSTYNGWPLYYYSRDEKPGDTTGQAVGGVWFVISPEGAPIQTNAVVKSAKNALGTVLTDASGRSIYIFTKDEKGKPSSCDAACRQAWPPLLSIGDPKADEGVTAAQLSALKRDDVSQQVTYNGYPLYYFAADEKPGELKGQTITAFGGSWFILSSAGEVIKSPAAGGASAPKPAGDGY